MPGRGQERPVSSSDKATGSSGEVADERAVGRRAVWLPLEPNPVLAFLYQAHGTAAGAPPQASTAVLLCPTFGWEEMCSYRGLRVWSQMLARAGYPAATFDLPGTGDSGGSARDPGLLDACTNAVCNRNRVRRPPGVPRRRPWRGDRRSDPVGGAGARPSVAT
jgi:hypothetical protein